MAASASSSEGNSEPGPPPGIVTRNIAVLGVSQHGKTFLLNSIRQLQGCCVSGEGATKVGDGNQRCTERPSLFHLHKPGEPTKWLSYRTLTLPAVASEGRLRGEVLEKAQRDHWQRLLEMGLTQEYRSELGLAEDVCVGCGSTEGYTSGMRHWRVRAKLSAAAQALQNPAQQLARAAPVPDDPPPRLCLKALDTPGVDDNKGQDETHIENIIEEVLQLGSLSGLVMVTKCGIAICPTWARQVLRYWKLFPMLRTQWIFVHTNADPLAVNNKQRRGSSASRPESTVLPPRSSFETMAAERVREVTKQMRDVTGDEAFDAAHLFVEMDYEGHECLKASLAEQLNIFFSHIATFSCVHIAELKFEKGPQLLEIDAVVVSALEALRSAMYTSRVGFDEDVTRLQKLCQAQRSCQEKQEKELNEIDNLLRHKDHDGPVERVRYVCQPLWWFHYPEEEVVIETQHRDYQVSVIDTSGYRRPYLTEILGKRKTEFLPNNCCKLTIFTQVPSVLARMQGKVVVSSRSQDVYKERIDEAKQKKEELTGSLAYARRLCAESEEWLYGKSEEKKRAEAYHKTVQAAIAFLFRPWDIATWQKMRPFYTWRQKFKQPPDTLEQVREFQRCWERAVEEEDRATWLFEPQDMGAGFIRRGQGQP